MTERFNLDGNEERNTIILNGTEVGRKMNGAIIEDKTTSPKVILAAIIGLVIVLAFASLLWCAFAPYERIVLNTEQCGLTQQKLDDGTTYLAKEFLYTEYYGEKPLLALSFKDEKGRFGSSQYLPKDDELIILDDNDQTEAYLEIETWTTGKINPITGDALFTGEEHVQPMKLYIHESELLKLENGTVEERTLKQRDNLVGTEYLAIKKDSRYIFNIEEKGWEFITGDFSGVEGDDFEVVILENPDEPAYVEGKIRVGRTGSLGSEVPPSPTIEEDHIVRAVFKPTKLYIHESEIVAAENLAPEPTPEPPPDPVPAPTPEPPDDYKKGPNDIPDAGVGWGRNDDSGPGPDTNYDADKYWDTISQPA